MLGLGLSIGGRLPTAGGGGPGGAPGVTAIAADGWRATYPDPPAGFDPEGDPETIAVRRSGHDASGAAVTVTDTLTVMARVRRPYPDHASLTPDQIALSDFVYAGDTIAGVTNNSTRPYPKPIAMWLNPDRDRATGQAYTARLAVAHAHARNGRPVAAVTFTATDGTTTVEQTIAPMSVLACASGLSIPHFEAALDFSALQDDALITIDAVIHPWVGEAFTISADADAYPSPNLCVLKVLNDVAYGTAYAYVDAASGDNGTAVVSETPATAAASPFATVAAAAAAIRTFNDTTFGRDNASGGVIRLEEGTHTHAGFGSVAVGEIPLVVEAVGAKAATVYQDAGSSTQNGIPDFLKFRGVTLRRNAPGDVVFLDSAATDAAHVLVLEDCTFDDAGLGPSWGGWFYRTGRVFLLGCDGADCGHADSFGSAAKMVLAIGSAGTCVGKTTYAAAGCVDLGTRYTDGLKTGNRPPLAGGFLGFSHLGTGSTASIAVDLSLAVGARGLALVGNVFEQYGSTTPSLISISADGVVAPAENLVVMCNTAVGSRCNFLYQDAGSAEVAKSGTFRFNVDRERNVKTDVFAGNGSLVGNWPHAWHVGDRANATLRGDSRADVYGAGEWLGEVAALGNVDGSDAAPLTPGWADDRSNDGAGGGGGDYTPQAPQALPAIPAGLAPHSHDQAGRAVADDGTGVAGALAPSSA